LFQKLEAICNKIRGIKITRLQYKLKKIILAVFGMERQNDFNLLISFIVLLRRIPGVKLFPPQLHHTIPTSSAVFYIFWWCPWMFSRTVLSETK